jgi:hypothetical protein
MSQTIHRVIGWRTTKISETEFRWQVYSSDYQVPPNILVSGMGTTRARAERQARKHCGQYRRIRDQVMRPAGSISV